MLLKLSEFCTNESTSCTTVRYIYWLLGRRESHRPHEKHRPQIESELVRGSGTGSSRPGLLQPGPRPRIDNRFALNSCALFLYCMPFSYVAAFLRLAFSPCPTCRSFCRHQPPPLLRDVVLQKCQDQRSLRCYSCCAIRGENEATGDGPRATSQGDSPARHVFISTSLAVQWISSGLVSHIALLSLVLDIASRPALPAIESALVAPLDLSSQVMNLDKWLGICARWLN